MELISDSVHKGLELYRLDPWRYGLIIYGIIGFIVFVFQMMRKEDDRYNPIPKIVGAFFIGLFWLRFFYYEYLFYKIGFPTALLFWFSSVLFLWNIVPRDHPITNYLNTLDHGLGTISDVQTNLFLLAIMIAAVLIGYFHIAPYQNRRLERLALEREQRLKAADLSSPDKWNK